MKVEFLEQFERDLGELRDPSLAESVAKVIESIERTTSLRELHNVKKLKGYRNIYRIRVRTHRLGFRFENGVVELARFLPRKDIYRLFP